MNKIKELLADWSVKRAIGKGTEVVAKAAAAYALAHLGSVQGAAVKYGVTLSMDPEQLQLALSGALLMGAKVAWDALKHMIFRRPAAPLEAAK